jgi:hypothetical protein
MSCYLRHLKEVLAEAGIELTSANRKQIDQAVHKAVGVAFKNCPIAWKETKARIGGDQATRQAFIAELKRALR